MDMKIALKGLESQNVWYSDFRSGTFADYIVMNECIFTWNLRIERKSGKKKGCRQQNSSHRT
jgi:hypothetical protein